MMRSWLQGSLGSAYRRSGRTTEALESLYDAFAASRELGTTSQIAWLVFELALCLGSCDETELAVVLLASAEAASEDLEIDAAIEHHAERSALRATARRRLGDELFERAWVRGHELPLLEAVALAFESGEAVLTASPDRMS